MFIPTEALTNLVCSFCQNYLSVFPIHYDDKEETFTCGRCPLLTASNLVRQVAYERLTRFMKFPCKFKESGCLESYIPSDLVNHENSCRYKPYFCPILPLGDCAWQGRHDKLLQHYFENHENLILKNYQVEINLISDSKEHYVFTHDNKTFIAYLSCNRQRDEFSGCVKFFGSVDEGKVYMYKITLQNDRGKKYEFQARPVQTEMINVLDHEKATHMDICTIKLTLNDPNYVLFNVKIFKNEIRKSSTEPLLSEKIGEEMLRYIECPICFLYMVPPIMQCNTGHSICNVCRPLTPVCPTCNDIIGNTRNFSLEEFTNSLTYPCKNQEYGCDYASTSRAIKDHEAQCKYGSFVCPIEACTRKTKLSDLMQHIEQQHEDNFLDIDIVTFIFTSGEREEATFITSAYDAVFKLHFLYDGASFTWSMQTIGADDDSCKYLFEIDICGDRGSERIFVRKNCSSFTEDNRLPTDNSYVELPENMLGDLIDDSTLSYAFRIVKQNI